MTTTIKTIGLCEINGKWVIAPKHAIAYKYADPTEDAKWLREDGEVNEVMSVDPSLIEPVAQCVRIGERGDGRIGGTWFAPEDCVEACRVAYERMEGLGPDVTDEILAAGGIYVIE